MQLVRTAVPCGAHIAPHVIMRNSHLICGNINDVFFPVAAPGPWGDRAGGIGMEAIGSTFGGGSLGGLVVAIVYLILGPGAVVFHLSRLALNRYSSRTRQRATLSPSEFETIRKCLPWNAGISLLPAIPFVLNGMHGRY
jgi:hypothetical protein